jgi:hypothetical protein
MAFGHGKDSRVLVNELHASGNVQSWAATAGRELADVTVILDGGYRWLPGLKMGRLSLVGLFDTAAATLHTETTAALGVDNGLLATVLPSGGAIGQPAFIAVSDVEGYSLESTVTEAVKLTVEAQPDDGVEWGVSLHDLGAETADADAASVDNAASSANGGVASLHVTAYSGLTNAVLKVQHSTNNSVWADLATFTTVTAVTSERVVVALGTTVNRYLRCTTDVTGTGSVTFAMAFARR